MVLRYHRGNIIFSACRFVCDCEDVLESEILAIKEGISLALQWSSLPIDVESDCLEVINTMQNGGSTTSGAAAIYSDCLVLVIGYTSITFVHCPREANSVSHDLARLARPSPSLWGEEPPDFIVKGLVDDVTII